ncbi:hypothetical protein [Belliella pelovolcani]|uniref:Uncharacterized protein n=1 Tax=Belliella pelovolcani TaxID=529505 RepID=A0A1N7M1X1_9BACT|nr:hypothetical protein [Belliella pelovolcani]SIS80106.1 hypothetical protein SAMN05421761_10520 [Belliella pelovolcani]
MIRRIIVNLLLAYTFVPCSFVLNKWIRIDGEFGEIMDVFEPFYFQFASFYLILVLLPFNIVIKSKNKYLKFVIWKKILILIILQLSIICFTGLFSNIWAHPIWKNLWFIVFFIPPSIIFATAIHFLVDLPDIRKLDNMVEKN